MPREEDIARTRVLEPSDVVTERSHRSLQIEMAKSAKAKAAALLKEATLVLEGAARSQRANAKESTRRKQDGGRELARAEWGAPRQAAAVSPADRAAAGSADAPGDAAPEPEAAAEEEEEGGDAAEGGVDAADALAAEAEAAAAAAAAATPEADFIPGENQKDKKTWEKAQAKAQASAEKMRKAQAELEQLARAAQATAAHAAELDAAREAKRAEAQATTGYVRWRDATPIAMPPPKCRSCKKEARHADCPHGACSKSLCCRAARRMPLAGSEADPSAPCPCPQHARPV
jgi:hypothetical protein